eukprot:TRINITY_DN2794_c0_g2_i13.p1 TRINITY_DN2794_c0_g2~~TRINITY_DN2794_c0_g2_i13.p1  ORF type:complete len:397 (+),score=61.73 TRINITY_DN2794_c0_g2_i13:153-1343(+)
MISHLLLFFSLSICFSCGDVAQIHISYTGKTNEMLLMWVSDSTDDPSIARYGLSPAHLSSQAQGTVDSYTNDQGYTSGGIHQVLLQDLSPSTTYFYQVGGDDWSSIYNFSSAPEDGTKDIVFGVIGDVGTDANSQETFRGLVAMKSKYGLDVVIHAGDLSYANDYDYGGPIWDKYGDILTPLASSTPYNPSVGNHEKQDNFLAFQYRYATDVLENNTNGGDFYWSFNYGIVHTIMLSSETDYGTDSTQYSWLKDDLAKIDRSVTPWVVAMWHTPWYNSNKAHQKAGEDMRESFEGLFYRYKVDIGIVGHVHAYERTHPVYQYEVTSGATRYITVGNGGTPEGLYFSWEPKPSWSAFRISEWGYSRLHFYNSTHAHWTMRDDSTESIKDDSWFIRGQ